MSDLRGLFISDPEVGHRYQPGARLRWRGVRYEINSQGWRGPDWSKVKKEDRVILCLGDSIAFGYGVPFEETFCHKLQILLDEKWPRSPSIVLNAASDSYNTEQELHIAKKLLPLWQPDLVLLNFYSNDIYPNPYRVDGQGRLYMPDGLSAPSPSFYSNLFPRFLMRHSFLCKFLDQRLTTLVSFWILQFPKATSWSYEARCWQKTEGQLRELVHLARRSHVQILFVYFPDVYELGFLKGSPPAHRLRRIAKELGVPLMDMRQRVRQSPREPFYLDVCHLNSHGHELAASALAKVVESLLTE